MGEPASHTLSGTAGEIVVHEWPADGARFVAVIAHGYGEHSRRYDHVAERLVEAGATVFALDHAGHGRSEGERALVLDGDAMADDLGEAIDLAGEVAPGLPLVLIGHSMGGLISTRFAQLNPGRLDALVLSGPVVGGNPAITGLLELDPIPEVPIDPAILSRDPAVGEAYLADPLVYHGGFKRRTLENFVDRIAAIAAGEGFGELLVLWIHGSEDGLAPLAETRVAIDRLSGTATEEKIYADARHEVFNETNRDAVLADVVDFIDRSLVR